jgi:CIC family chloride channel protein
VRHAWRRLELFLARNLGLRSDEDRLFFLLVPGVGLVAGFVGFAVTAAIYGVQRVLWGSATDFAATAAAAPPWMRVAVPAFGGVLVGLIVFLVRRRMTGHGISGIIEAVALRRGDIPPGPSLQSLAASIVAVGSGGSLGREGPTIRTSAMGASWLGQRFNVSERRRRILVGCGAAAGIAAIYNTPVGAALFGMEVILGSFALDVFGPLVVASVIATFVGRSLIGSEPMYQVAGEGLVSWWELGTFAGLGLLGAFASAGFTRGIGGFEAGFRGLGRLPDWAKPVLGMALVGVLGLVVPQVYGNGFETITAALHGGLPLTLLVVLPFAKIAASGLTLGSGCPGGLFTPSLFVGAMLGGLYGTWLDGVFPGQTSGAGAYAAVGMAALAAGTSHAPISAIMMLFEITGNYDLILPLMLASILSSLVSRRLTPASIYIEPLLRRGVRLPRRSGEFETPDVRVAGLVRPDPDTLTPGAPWRHVVDRFLGVNRQRLFVLDADRRLLGAISLHDLKHVLDTPGVGDVVVAQDLMTPVPIVLRDSDDVPAAVALFARSEFERVPVVDADGRFLGVLGKSDVLGLYARDNTEGQ